VKIVRKEDPVKKKAVTFTSIFTFRGSQAMILRLQEWKHGL